MRKLLLSGVLITVALTAVIMGTRSFFSDTETSEGNSFQAGKIDLKVGNESYLIRDGVVTAQPQLSWTLRDLTNEVFFNFDDIKPGDMSEDTISLGVEDNDSWLCFDLRLTGAPENTVLEPEINDGDTEANGNWEGELDDNLSFIFWADDGDNVLEDNEQNGFIMDAKASDLLQGDGNPGIRFPLADSIINVWKATLATPENPEINGPVTGGQSYFIGKAWCYGEFSPLAVPVAQDNLGGGNANGPTVRGAGIECVGTSTTNIAQTDGIEGVVSFYAEQSRNNANFVCNPDIEL